MKLVTGAALDPAKFFQHGTPKAQGSSFDLTVGKIYDTNGQEVSGPYVLQPGHMVQVVSEEIFNLSDKITGHVTYKTGLTQEGIWALTVGIVDPGWNGPIATTLLNFSEVKHTVQIGDAFLRVSFFEHDAVPTDKIRKVKTSLPDYYKEVRSRAATKFPPTFLNRKEIADQAAKEVLHRLRDQGLPWLAGIALVFTAIQIFAPPISRHIDQAMTHSQVQIITKELKDLKMQVADLKKQNKQNAVVKPAEKKNFKIAKTCRFKNTVE